MEHDTEQESSHNDRKYFRVRVDIPIRITPLEDNEVDQHATEVLSLVDLPAPEIDSALVAWLDRIERKLDRLLAHEHLPEGPGIVIENHVNVDLSAAGLRLESKETFDPGSAALVEFEIPEVPVRLVRCVGRIRASESKSDSAGYVVDIAFETIRQSDRDAVVRYTLVVQRQEIRGGLAHGGHGK